MRDRAIGALIYGGHRKTWEEAVIEWSGHIQGEVSETTRRRYAVSLCQIKAPLSGRFVDEIDKRDVLDIVKFRRQQVTNATIRRDLQALSSVFQYAELNDWRTGNPAKLIMETLSERRDPIVLPSEADFAFMLSRLSPMMGALMVAARATGARISELTMATRAQLNAQAGTLTVIGKRNKRRTIQLDENTAEMLSRLPASINGQRLFCFGTGTGQNASSLFSRATRATRFAAKEQQCEFTGFRFHDLRHWFAVDWLKSGRSIYDLQQHLGHSSVSTTEMYLQFLTVEQKEVAKRPSEARQTSDAALAPQPMAA